MMSLSPLVVAEQPTEPHLPMHDSLGHRQRRPRPSQHALAEEHHLRQALVLDCLHEPLGDGVHVRRTHGGEHGLDASARQRLDVDRT